MRRNILFISTRPKLAKGVCLLAFVGVLLFGMMALDINRTLKVYARAQGFHVVIDAGHGGKDKGAQSKNGTFERDINLAIAKFLKIELETRNIGVTMTRENNDWLAPPTARNKKKADMDARRRTIERVKPDLVISIHLNTFPGDTSVRGLQTFYDKSGEKSKTYAEAIQNEFNQSPLATNRHARIGDYYILDSTAFPSVLVECGFLTNPEDEKLLNTREYQRIVAYYIASAVASQQHLQSIA
jgi:N-acetylmuramoyl-L-alanine amidase